MSGVETTFPGHVFLEILSFVVPSSGHLLPARESGGCEAKFPSCGQDVGGIRKNGEQIVPLGSAASTFLLYFPHK